jgi:hypothetical protein
MEGNGLGETKEAVKGGRVRGGDGEGRVSTSRPDDGAGDLRRKNVETTHTGYQGDRERKDPLNWLLLEKAVKTQYKNLQG